MKEPDRTIDEQDATELPDREAMSLIDPARVAGPLPPIIAPDGGLTDELPTTGQGMVEKPPTP